MCTTLWVAPELLEELGGRFHLSTPVREILVKDGAAAGVVTETGDVFHSDAVISNADVANTYLRMIPERYRRKNSNRRLKRLRYSMSLFVVYFGTRKKYPAIRHHTIILGERYRGLLDDIFNRKTLSTDFSLYLHRPTATDPSMAPAGCDCLYALIPVPNQLSGIDWAEEGPRYYERVMEFLERTHLPGLRKDLLTQ